MKYIAKRKRHLDCLYDEKIKPPIDAESARNRWQRFSRNNNYNLLVDTLHEEQYRLCAYTELRLEELGFGFHVEHVKPKSKYPLQTFDYRNLVLSALSSTDLENLKIQYNSEPISSFGGHSKRSHFNKKQFLSPLLARTKHNYLLYLNNGKIIPNPIKSRRYQKKAKYTIDLLNLNHSILVTRRKEWIEELDQLIDQHLDDDRCLTCLAGIDLEPTDGKLSNFFTATCQRFGPAISNPITRRYY